MSKTETAKQNTALREPVICVLGHIDHGKSSLLDYIRKTNITEKEAGGITQCISACEVEYKSSSDNKLRKITFLDTPGHEAFRKMRSRGARVADIAVLVVSAEDGVKQQTKEAYEAIKEANIPFVVAITKIDKPNADVEKTKSSLAESGIYLEGYGGDVSYVAVSSKTGEGVDDLLNLLSLTADVIEIKGDTNQPGEGFVIESKRDPKKGIHAVLIVRGGRLETGMHVVCGKCIAPVRILEDSLGKPIKSVVCGSPVRLFGWSCVPNAGGYFKTYDSKKLAEQAISEFKGDDAITNNKKEVDENKKIIPIVIKADSLGSIEAIVHELEKISHERITVKIVFSGVGNISESDVKMLSGIENPLILGFNVKIDNQAKAVAERQSIKIEVSNIIYELAKWLEAFIKESAPRIKVEEILGEAKIMRLFSKTKDRQIVGGKVTSGEIAVGHKVRIKRRENVIGEGLIRELQQQKEKTSSVKEGFEFGTMIESKIELAPGDFISDFIIVEKQ